MSEIGQKFDWRFTEKPRQIYVRYLRFTKKKTNDKQWGDNQEQITSLVRLGGDTKVTDSQSKTYGNNA